MLVVQRLQSLVCNQAVEGSETDPSLLDLLQPFYADDLEIAGVIVTVDHAGELRIERALVRKEDVKKLPKAQGAETGLVESGQSETRSRCTRKNSRAC